MDLYGGGACCRRPTDWSRHRRLLPVALLLGAALLMGADFLGRVVLSPKEIPSGLVVALFGVPYFIA